MSARAFQWRQGQQPRAWRTLICLAASTACLVAVLIVHHANARAAGYNPTSPDCGISYGAPTPSGWSSGGYSYKVYAYGLAFVRKGFTSPPDGSHADDEMDSWNCNGGGAGNFAGDVVDTTAGGKVGLDVSGYGKQAPIAARLGAPAGAPSYSGGSLSRPACLPRGSQAMDNPPVIPCNYGNIAVLVDDSGRAVIGGQLGDTMIYCQAFVGTQPSANYQNCGPTIDSSYYCTLGENYASVSAPACNNPQKGGIVVGQGGAGGLYVDDNCSPEPGCNSAYFSWYKDYLNVNNGGRDTDLTSIIGTLGNDTLRDYYLHLSSINTISGGWGTTMYVTYTYPIIHISATCTSSGAHVVVQNPLGISQVNYSSSIGSGLVVSNDFTVPAGAGFTASTTIAGTTIVSSPTINCFVPPKITITALSCSSVTFDARDPVVANDPVTVTSVQNDRTKNYANLKARNGTSYTYDISPWQGYAAETFIIRATDSGGTSTQTFTKGPCVNPRCTGAGFQPPGDVEVGEQFSAQVNIDDSQIGPQGALPSQSDGDNVHIIINGPGKALYDGDAPYTAQRGTPMVNANTGKLSTTTPGTYTMTASFSGPGFTPVGCKQEKVIIVDKPYFTAQGGDVVAGSGFAAATVDDPAKPATADTCQDTNGMKAYDSYYTGYPTGGSYPYDKKPHGATTLANPHAGIYAFNGEGNDYTKGSLTNLAALGPYYIYGFASASGTNAPGSGAQPPDRLTFANNASPTYSGQFGDAPCVPDYLGMLRNDPHFKSIDFGSANSPKGTSNKVRVGSTAWDVVSLAASPTPDEITGSLNLQANHIWYLDTEYAPYQVPQNLYISGNITDNANWNSLSTMPLQIIIVRGGNIYIDASVTELDAIIIAEPDHDGDEGNIYTCSDVGAGNITYSPAPLNKTSKIFNTCSTQLTVHGALIGRAVHLLRTKGSMSSGPPAEQVIYSPQDWLLSPFSPTSAINAIQSLSPVL